MTARKTTIPKIRNNVATSAGGMTSSDVDFGTLATKNAPFATGRSCDRDGDPSFTKPIAISVDAEIENRPIASAPETNVFTS